jgi:hypothetical protein
VGFVDNIVMMWDCRGFVDDIVTIPSFPLPADGPFIGWATPCTA